MVLKLQKSVVFMGLLCTAFSLAVLRIRVGLCASDNDHGRALRLAVVSDFVGVHELYLRIRTRVPHSMPSSMLSVRLKQTICRSITTSEYFNIIGRDPVDVEAVHEELTTKYRYTNVLHHFYEMSAITIPVKRINVVLASRVVSEYTFACLARNRVTNKIEEYRISQPYNVNEAFTRVLKYIAGYFIFAFIPTDHSWVMHSFAEEAAETPLPILQRDVDVEQLYKRVREQHKSEATTSADDPLCKLNHFQKLRVCTSVLNSSYFDDKIGKFQPSLCRVTNECKKRTVLLRTNTARMTENGAESRENLFRSEEWTFSCVALSTPILGIGGECKYFISRAYSSNKVFVYTRQYDQTNLHLYLESQSDNVSVVMDEMNNRLYDD